MVLYKELGSFPFAPPPPPPLSGAYYLLPPVGSAIFLNSDYCVMSRARQLGVHNVWGAQTEKVMNLLPRLISSLLLSVIFQALTRTQQDEQSF